MRPYHYLKHNALTSTPDKFVVFDTETLPQDMGNGVSQHNLRLGVADCINLRVKTPSKRYQRLEFTDSSTFWDWLDSLCNKRERLFVFAHNLSFDAQVLKMMANMERLNYSPVLAITESPPTILNYRNDSRTIVLLDTLNYFTMSLQALGNFVGLAKMTMPEFSAPDKDWLDYCRRDTDVLRLTVESLLQFCRDNDMGNFRVTAASMAFGAFRHRFMKVPILIHANEKVLELERDSYYGGRTECFHIGELTGEYYQYDVNSMYPFIMADKPFPTRIAHHTAKATTSQLTRWLEQYAVTAKVLLKTDKPYYPVRYGGKLIFPVGTFSSTLSSPELLLALKGGHIQKIGETALYDQDRIFKAYVAYFYPMRQRYKASGNKPFELLCKMMLNSLYGKFGQRKIIWEFVDMVLPVSSGEYEEYDPQTNTTIRYRVIGGKVQRLIKESEASDSFPAIAAHVTAYARCYLYSLIELAGTENVYYCDTDSLLVNRNGSERLKALCHPSKLGMLKQEAVYSKVVLRGLKDYSFDSVTKIKGVRAKATRIDENTFSQEQFRSIGAAISAGDNDRQITKVITKHLSRTYNKGTVSPSGRVVPITL